MLNSAAVLYAVTILKRQTERHKTIDGTIRREIVGGGISGRDLPARYAELGWAPIAHVADWLI